MLQLTAALALGWVLLAAPSEGPSVFEQLTRSGVRLQSGEMVRLPAPIMPDGLDAAKQREVLRKTAGKYPLDRFLRNAVVAPFVLEINSIDGGQQRRGGQRVDFYFVAHGSQRALFEEGLFDELVGVQEAESPGLKPMTTHTLTADELRQRYLTARDTGDLVETYLAVEVPILERVELSGAGLGMKQRTDQSLLGAWILDDHFLNDPEFPNRWRPILRDELGRLSRGTATPYSGLGGYIKITRLREPATAVFVECHAAFDEPYGWFEGKNLLRSKLPLAVQDNVRSFRRKYAKLGNGE